ncbi:hypothetical protein [Roseibacillus persicicus]|uniref:Uncharacterized protein n=1 Tax=Roseibacillus persicicus TaxID=454148 RepID=A0A918TY85_9BACT|nr:hypothetical protein [Roseibacillus persicicus]GHC64308.1 hypothetical protein GCM10007100_35020 [Roseibacillus persicicus]
MKSFFSFSPAPLLCGLLFSATNLASADLWMTSLVQKQLDGSGTFQTYVDAKGEGVSVAAVPEGGSEFFLWAIKYADSGMEETLVDSEVVGAYMPEGTLKIRTDDPYNGPIPRTRIDQGFKVRYTVDGLVSGNDAPEAARQVLLDHDVAAYEPITNEGLLSMIGSIVQGLFENLLPAVDFDQRMITKNGKKNLKFNVANIPGNDVYSDAGVETFRLYALPDGQVAQMLLDEAQIQVWPMSKGTITGLTDQGSYSSIPEVRVALTNLYPDSTTWVQVYKGESKPGKVGTDVTEAHLVVDDVIPRAVGELVFRDLQQYFTDEGPWTLEVLSETPFGTEILDSVEINIASGLKLRGSFNSLSE